MSISSLGRGLLGDVDGSPDLAGRFDGGHLLVPLFASEARAAPDQFDLALAAARANGASLTVISPVPVPEDDGVDECDGDGSGSPLDRTLGKVARRPDVDVAHVADVTGRAFRAVGDHEVDTMVLPGGAGRLRGRLLREGAARAGCDVAVVNGRASDTDSGGVASVLLPVAGGIHSGLATDLARTIATDAGAWVDVLHVVGPDADEARRKRAETLVESARRRLDRPETTSTWVLESDDVATAITEQSRCYDLTVLGAPTKGRLRRLVGGSTTRVVRAEAESVVLSAWNNSPPS
jgi:nucleotide-binding universal stress UspA family protein